MFFRLCLEGRLVRTALLVLLGPGPFYLLLRGARGSLDGNAMCLAIAFEERLQFAHPLMRRIELLTLISLTRLELNSSLRTSAFQRRLRRIVHRGRSALSLIDAESQTIDFSEILCRNMRLLSGDSSHRSLLATFFHKSCVS